jgi:hypothetical protein
MTRKLQKGGSMPNISMFSSKPSTPVAVDIGMASIFDFFCAVLSRIAYTEDPLPLFLISQILDNIIPPEIIAGFAKISSTNFNTDDDQLFDLINNPNRFPIRTYTDDSGQQRKAINFIPYAEKINALIEGATNYANIKTDPNVEIISIADSNYGDLLVFGIKTMPNLVFASFRGTYSTKTAQSYVQLASLSPFEINDTTHAAVLKGIEKITLQISHATTDAMKHIATNFLKDPNPSIPVLPIPVFTGHSLGGAMATLFEDQYFTSIKNFDSVQTVLNQKSICVSFGAPRALNSESSIILCKEVVAKDIIMHRYSNDGDPVTSLPPPKFGFFHPCSDTLDKKAQNRKFVSRDCKSSTVMRPTPQSDYTKSIKCIDKEPSTFTKLINIAPNIADHMTYLYLSFAKAADIVHLFLNSALTFHTTEIARVLKTNLDEGLTAGDTEMRLDIMQGNGSTGTYTVDFVDLKSLEVKDGVLAEDAKDTMQVFNQIESSSQGNYPYKISFSNTGMPLPIPKNSTGALEDAIKKYRDLVELEKTPKTYLNPALLVEATVGTNEVSPNSNPVVPPTSNPVVPPTLVPSTLVPFTFIKPTAVAAGGKRKSKRLNKRNSKKTKKAKLGKRKSIKRRSQPKRKKTRN